MDLGLPSGALWATCNVGASKPSDYGQYFQWGDTKGYTYDQVGKEKQFTWTNYKWSINGSDANFSKYTTTGATLELEDDAAHINMGGDWHMPTPAQFQELISTANTTSTWTTQNGVNGRLLTSKKDTSKSIFFPAAGFGWGGSISYRGSNGSIWSSMLGTGKNNVGQNLGFDGTSFRLINGNFRDDGYPVRGVIG